MAGYSSKKEQGSKKNMLKDIRRNKEERAETISRPKKSPSSWMVSRRGGSGKAKGWVSCQSCEDDKEGTKPVEDRMLPKELNKDVCQLVPLVKLTKEEREHHNKS